MILWLGAQLSPHLARWVTSEFGIEAKPVRELGLREARDREIFFAARDADAVVMTEDGDFVLLLEQLGSPPQILWLTRILKEYCQGVSPKRGRFFFEVSRSEISERL